MLAAGPVSTWSESRALAVRLLLRALPSTIISLFLTGRILFPMMVGLYLGTHCRGACEAGLNWRPANLACRPLNLAHLVEWLTKHIAVKYSPHSSVFYALSLASRVFNHFSDSISPSSLCESALGRRLHPLSGTPPR